MNIPATQIMWSNFEKTCTEKAATILGRSNGGLSNNKDPTWWTEDVKQLVKEKRDLFKLWQNTRLEEDRAEYKRAKKMAKRKVAQSMAECRENLYNRLEQAQTDSEIFKIAKHTYLVWTGGVPH